MYFYFNPNYRLEIENKRIVIYDANLNGSCNFKFREGFCASMHPLHAIILTQINGVTSLDRVVTKVTEVLGIELKKDELLSLLNKLINNKHNLGFKYKDWRIIFPAYTIVTSDVKILDYPEYAPDEFLLNEIDLEPQRLKMLKSLNISTTYKCYTNCIYCFQDRSNPAGQSVMPLEKMQEVIREAYELGIPRVETMGGESLLYPYWYELHSEMHKYGYGSSLISTKLPLNNGHVEKLKLLKIKTIQFSLDSMIRSSLKKIVRIKGDYINEIESTFKLLEKNNIRIDVHTIINRYNSSIQDMESIFRFLKLFRNINEWRVDLMYSSYFNNQDYKNISAPKEELNEIRDFLNKLDTNQFNITPFDENDEVKMYDNTKDFIFKNGVICPANMSQMTILPDGKVTICEKLYWTEKFIIGDINKQTIKEIWESEKALKLYNLRRNNTSSSSPCSKCSDSKECNSRVAYCYANIIDAYGIDNWTMPDPCCPESKKIYSFKN